MRSAVIGKDEEVAVLGGRDGGVKAESRKLKAEMKICLLGRLVPL